MALPNRSVPGPDTPLLELCGIKVCGDKALPAPASAAEGTHRAGRQQPAKKEAVYCLDPDAPRSQIAAIFLYRTQFAPAMVDAGPLDTDSQPQPLAEALRS